MADKKYNGWTNYETWVVKLWLDNDEATQHRQADLLDEAVRASALWGTNPLVLKTTVLKLGYRLDPTGQEIWTWSQAIRFTLGELLKQFVEDKNLADEEQPTMYTDLLRSAIDAVNYTEIADHIYWSHPDYDAVKP